MESYQEDFACLLASSGALFFKEDLILKDGRPTPYFVNMGNMNGDALHMQELGDAYANMVLEQMDRGLKVNTLFGPAYKGISIANHTQRSLLRNGINLGVVHDRKEAKTHGEGSGGGSSFVGEFREGSNIFLVDDVMTSARTKYEALEMINNYASEEGIDLSVVGVGIAFDRQQNNLEGKSAIEVFTEDTGVPVCSIVGAKEAIYHLLNSETPLRIGGKMQRMSQQTYDGFLKYMEEFGTK